MSGIQPLWSGWEISAYPDGRGGTSSSGEVSSDRESEFSEASLGIMGIVAVRLISCLQHRRSAGNGSFPQHAHQEGPGQQALYSTRTLAGKKELTCTAHMETCEEGGPWGVHTRTPPYGDENPSLRGHGWERE